MALGLRSFWKNTKGTGLRYKAMDLIKSGEGHLGIED